MSKKLRWYAVTLSIWEIGDRSTGPMDEITWHELAPNALRAREFALHKAEAMAAAYSAPYAAPPRKSHIEVARSKTA